MPAAKKKRNLDISLENITASQLKPLGLPFLSIFLLVAFSIIAYKMITQKVASQKAQINVLKKNEQVLAEKVRVLSEFQNYITPRSVESLNAALPEKNSALLMLSQIKSLVNNFSLIFTNLNVSTPIRDQTGLFKVEIQFDIDGDVRQIISFLKILKNYSPVSTVTEVSFSNTEDISRASINMHTYFSEYPDKLPAITEPITNLTQEELQTLSAIENFVVPSFVELQPAGLNSRSNPFE